MTATNSPCCKVRSAREGAHRRRVGLERAVHAAHFHCGHPGRPLPAFCGLVHELVHASILRLARLAHQVMTCTRRGCWHTSNNDVTSAPMARAMRHVLLRLGRSRLLLTKRLRSSMRVAEWAGSRGDPVGDDHRGDDDECHRRPRNQGVVDDSDLGRHGTPCLTTDPTPAAARWPTTRARWSSPATHDPAHWVWRQAERLQRSELSPATAHRDDQCMGNAPGRQQGQHDRQRDGVATDRPVAEDLAGLDRSVGDGGQARPMATAPPPGPRLRAAIAACRRARPEAPVTQVDDPDSVDELVGGEAQRDGEALESRSAPPPRAARSVEFVPRPAAPPFRRPGRSAGHRADPPAPDPDGDAQHAARCGSPSAISSTRPAIARRAGSARPCRRHLGHAMTVSLRSPTSACEVAADPQPASRHGRTTVPRRRWPRSGTHRPRRHCWRPASCRSPSRTAAASRRTASSSTRR